MKRSKTDLFLYGFYVQSSKKLVLWENSHKTLIIYQNSWFSFWYWPQYSIWSHHHHHVMLVARISLTLSRPFSLSFIASGRSSGLHPVSSHSCWMYVRAGRPAFARPYVRVHKSTSLMSSSLLLQQCPACLVYLTWIVFVIGGRWPYSWCLVGCCRQDLSKIARSNWDFIGLEILLINKAILCILILVISLYLVWYLFYRIEYLIYQLSLVIHFDTIFIFLSGRKFSFFLSINPCNTFWY